jgi:hypothetical protein
MAPRSLCRDCDADNKRPVFAVLFASYSLVSPPNKSLKAIEVLRCPADEPTVPLGVPTTDVSRTFYLIGLSAAVQV